MTVTIFSFSIFSFSAAILTAPHLMRAAESASPSPVLTAGSDPVPATGRTERITLAAAISEALAQSPTLRVIDAEIESARGEILTAQTRPRPEFTAAPGLKHVREPGNSHNEFKGTFAYNQTFTFPGKRELLVSIAERNVEVRKLGIDGLRFQLTAAVRKAFYELLAAQSFINLRQQQIESALIFQQAAGRRAQAGYASDFEAVRSHGDVINARKLLGAAQGQIAEARVELAILLGRDPSTRLEAAGSLNPDVVERSLGDLVALALEINPSLRVQAMQAEIAGLNVRRARLMRKSDFSIGPTLEYSRSEQVFGMAATITLPNKSYGRGEILTATAEQRRVLAETERLRREIAGAVAKAVTQMNTARSQLALYSPTYLGQLKSVVEQAERSYAQNATSLLIYLDAKRTYFDTLADYYEAVANQATSLAELESAVGASFESNSARPTP
jgi:cobalt-zinc-cadmium efflux system outer membrane protein